ncbi:MlaD family protein, partial [Mycolicibacter sinensis]|uniref:MlaD family protein n=2 Tax=Mycobacteriaceae TaxID=1762 RepID=UPI0013F4D0CA
MLAALIAGALIVAAAAAYYLSPFGGHITVTAQFDSAAGLYEGNVVAVLGMPVGKVKKVTPKGGYVEAEFTVDRDVKIPADVHAVTINTSILTARQI